MSLERNYYKKEGKKMSSNQDIKMTKKELSDLCRKQENYIKELEEKLNRLTQTEECNSAPKKPEYEQLAFDNGTLQRFNAELNDNLMAFSEGLRLIYKEKRSETDRADFYHRQYIMENKRANELYEKWRKLQEEKEKQE